MKIRNKILLYFSFTSIILVGIIFIVVYLLFSEYREADFQERQKEKIITTLQFISEVEKDEHDLAEAIDRLRINSILNEKLLIFNESKKLIYSNLDDVPINYSSSLLNDLNEFNVWIEQKDGMYDVLAIHFTSNKKSYYGISKAYDELGYEKLSKLGIILMIAFIVFTVLVIFISIFISNKISKPISELAALLGGYRIGENNNEIEKSNTFEIDYLNLKFNELVKRTNNAYLFQKNSINYISHQLKTPIAILILELEKINNKISDQSIKASVNIQIEKTKSLAEIINTLLEISKIESNENLFKRKEIRVDELIFDCINELNESYPSFIFEINYSPNDPNTNLLVLKGDEMLLKQAFLNLLNNCINYSSNSKAIIEIDVSDLSILKISFINNGKTLTQEEEKYLFTHFFRGENSRNNIGFGLGLTLTKSIIQHHKGNIKYSSPKANINIFTIEF